MLVILAWAALALALQQLLGYWILVWTGLRRDRLRERHVFSLRIPSRARTRVASYFLPHGIIGALAWPLITPVGIIAGLRAHRARANRQSIQETAIELMTHGASAWLTVYRTVVMVIAPLIVLAITAVAPDTRTPALVWMGIYWLAMAAMIGLQFFGSTYRARSFAHLRRWKRVALGTAALEVATFTLATACLATLLSAEPIRASIVIHGAGEVLLMHGLFWNGIHGWIRDGVLRLDALVTAASGILVYSACLVRILPQITRPLSADDLRHAGRLNLTLYRPRVAREAFSRIHVWGLEDVATVSAAWLVEGEFGEAKRELDRWLDQYPKLVAETPEAGTGALFYLTMQYCVDRGVRRQALNAFLNKRPDSASLLLVISMMVSLEPAEGAPYIESLVDALDAENSPFLGDLIRVYRAKGTDEAPVLARATAERALLACPALHHEYVLVWALLRIIPPIPELRECWSPDHLERVRDPLLRRAGIPAIVFAHIALNLTLRQPNSTASAPDRAQAASFLEALEHGALVHGCGKEIAGLLRAQRSVQA